jgi:hypothetical protein
MINPVGGIAGWEVCLRGRIMKADGDEKPAK